jgi:hypothetical protein
MEPKLRSFETGASPILCRNSGRHAAFNQPSGRHRDRIRVSVIQKSSSEETDHQPSHRHSSLESSAFAAAHAETEAKADRVKISVATACCNKTIEEFDGRDLLHIITR